MTSRLMSRIILSAALLLSCAGCLQIDSTLELEANGAGKWKLLYSMPTHIFRQMQAARELAADLAKAGGDTQYRPQPLDIPCIFDEAEIKKRFEPLRSQGVRLVKLQVGERGGWQRVDMTVRFDNLADLLRQPFFSACAFSMTRLADRNWKFTAAPPRLSVDGAMPDYSDEETRRKTVAFLNGMRIVVRIDFPGTIKNSNSYMSDLRRATWEWDFDKDSRILERLDRETMAAVIDGRGVRFSEFDKPAEVRSPSATKRAAVPSADRASGP